MKVAVVYNRMEIRDTDVINLLGMPTKERYSPKVVEKVAAALELGGHNVRIIEGNMQVIDELQQFMPRVVRGERPGMVFNMAYGIQGQSRYTHIPSLLEMLGIPYVGSGPEGHALALDKVMSKIVFLRHGLPTPGFWLFSGPDEDLANVRYPCIVKPRMEAVSFGLRRVTEPDQLREAVAEITAEFHQAALVEEFIAGREFAVALLGNGATLETLPIVEIDLGGDPDAVQSLEQKTQRPRGKICPPELAPTACDELSRLARGAFQALGLFDFARVDFRMDAGGGLHILEINSMASLNPTGSFVRSAEVAGLDFTALVNRMLDVASARYFGAPGGDARELAGRGPHAAESLHSRIRRYLRGHLPTIVEYAEHMISIESHARNVQGVNQLGEWITTRFQRLQFDCQVYPQTEVGNVLYFTNHGEERNDVLILGHLDTVYSYQDYVPFAEDRGRIRGSGAAESKGGLAITLVALQALRFARVLRKLRCGVLITTDNTLGGRYTGGLVADLAARSNHVIGTKHGDPAGTCVVSCSGSQEYFIELTGTKLGRKKPPTDLVAILARKCTAWQKLSSAQQGIRIIINSLSAQTHPGRIADHAAVTITARFLNRLQSTRLDHEIRAIAERGADGYLQVQIRSGSRRLPVVQTPESRGFFEQASVLAGQMAVMLEPIHRDIPSDICEVPEGVPVLDGLGPVGVDARSPNEHILRDSLIDRAALLALILHSCRANSGRATGNNDAQRGAPAS
jgi:D-alanine-D-alanine ligase